MGSSMLTGYISYQIATFPTLTEIVLSNNQLYGSIPISLGNLTNLRVLDLSGNQLTGSVPASLTNLQGLEKLYLGNNYFEGSIPEKMTNLKSLQYLDISSNQLTGQIPETLTDCQNLISISLRYNFLSGSLPKNLEALSSLNYLNLFSNSLSGPLGKLGKLSKLETLFLEENNFDGELPKELGALSNLRDLSLLSNKFTGKIPDEYHQLTGLRSFGLGGNNLTGSIPAYIANWHNLTLLNLLGNNFEGNLPEGIFNLPNLQTLWVSDISNPGITLPGKAYLESVESVTLRNCSINGSIPEYIGEWPELKYLDLSFNNLVDDIPDSLRKLDDLILTRNMLSGKPPLWITEDVLLHFLAVDVSYNNFDLPCPEEECAPFSIVKIHPSRTFISDMKAKKCDHKYKSLFINSGGEKVDIGKHRYHTDTTTSNFYLNSSDHWACSFSGDYFDSSTAKTYVKNVTCDLSVPETNLYANFRVAPVSLTYYGLCLHKGEYNVTLHFTESIYSKYVDYSIAGKRVFDVYSQGLLQLKDFNIKEKAGQPNTEWKESFSAKVHDDGVLEVHLFWAGKGSLYNPPNLNGPVISAISITHVPRKLSALEIAGITVACSLVLPLLYAFMWRMEWIGDRELRKTKINIGKRTFTLKQIIDATGKFSSSMEIGRGRSGIVYMARMKANHQKLPTLIAAVKKLFFRSKATDEVVVEQPEQTIVVKKEASKAADEVVVEQPEQTVTMKNEDSKAADEVVAEQPELSLAVKKLFSGSKAVVVAQPAKNVEQPKFIVSVKKLFSRSKAALTVAVQNLFSQSKAGEVPQPTTEVSQTVDQIASEVYAKKGLVLKHDNLVQLLASYSKHHLHLLIYEYMERGSLRKALFEPDAQLAWQKRFHICKGIAKGLKFLHERNSPIIHRNIKATNILLDANYNPKISDLGLAKLYEEENPYFLIGAGEDLLYMAPEYATRRAMTVKVDVYSFGILVLEIVSGKNNSEYPDNREGDFLLDTALTLHANGKLGELVDKRSWPYDWDQADKVLKLAIMCINQSPSLRPTMSQVVSVLEGEKSLEAISEEITPHADQ